MVWGKRRQEEMKNWWLESSAVKTGYLGLDPYLWWEHVGTEVPFFAPPVLSNQGHQIYTQHKLEQPEDFSNIRQV